MKRSMLSTVALATVFVFGTSLTWAHEVSQDKLKAEAKVTEADARTTALAKVPAGTVSSAELEKEHGRLIWSFDIAQPDSTNITEIQVDAKTGKIVSSKVETAQKEAKEAAAEAKEGKAK